MSLDRRIFMQGAFAGLGIALTLQELSVKAAEIASGRNTYYFLTADEARVLSTLVDRIIPADDYPSASQAGVVDFIDLQLASIWGKGARLYMQGPFADSTPEQGYQLRYPPAEFYRVALKAILADPSFASSNDASKDAYITRLEKNEIKLGDIPGGTFFEVLRADTMEGYFSDPAYGGNRNFSGWRQIGFPGADAYYLTEIDRYNLAYDRSPSGITSGARGSLTVFKPDTVPINVAPRLASTNTLGG